MTAGTTTVAPSDALIAAVDGLIWNALTVAGAKMRHSRLCRRGDRWWAYHTDPAIMHSRLRVDQHQVAELKLLDDAWGRVPEIARRYGINADCLTDALDSYTRELIAAGVLHEFDRVPAVLRQATCPTDSGGFADA